MEELCEISKRGNLSIHAVLQRERLVPESILKCSVDLATCTITSVVRDCFVVTYFVRDVVSNGRNTMEGTPDSSTRRVLVRKHEMLTDITIPFHQHRRCAT